MADPTRVLLVRHGESQVTVAKVVGGERSCTGLSPHGREQSQRLHDRFAAGGERSVDALYSSTMPRAFETAEILTPALGGLPITQDVDLVEHRPGEADGMSFLAAVEKYGEFPGDREPHHRFAPGAETLAEFHLRVGAALQRLVDTHRGETVLVACHGGVIETAFRTYLGIGWREKPFDLWALNTSITEFVQREPRGRWRLHRFNDAAHLL